MFSEWYLNRRYAKGRAEGRAQGRARERKRWESWNRARLAAEEKVSPSYLRQPLTIIRPVSARERFVRS